MTKGNLKRTENQHLALDTKKFVRREVFGGVYQWEFSSWYAFLVVRGPRFT